MRFEPRAVPASSAWAWLRDALDLASRRWDAHLALGLGYAGVVHVLGAVAPTELELAWLSTMPLVLAIAVQIAWCADTGKSVVAELRRRPSRWARAFGLAALVPSVVVVIGIGLGAVVETTGALVEPLATDAPRPGGEPGIASPPSPVRTDAAASPVVPMETLGTVAVGAAVWYLCAGAHMLLFGAPLVVCGGLGIGQAMRQSWRGVAANPWTHGIWMSVFGATLFVVVRAPLLAVPLVAIYAAVLYVGYRHLWLDRTDNAPAVRSQEGAAARRGREPT